MTQKTKIEHIVEWLNDALETDAMYWKDEFGCEPEEVIDKFGFGYDENMTIRYLPDLEEVLMPVDDLYETVKMCKISRIKMRELISRIFEGETICIPNA